MKTVITPSYTFTPSSQTLDLSSYSGFSIKCLYAVINQTRGTIIYATGTTGYGYSAYSSGVLTLQASTTGMSSTDDLMIIYDVSNADGGSLAHITNFPSTQAISGNISVSNLPSTQVVSVTNFPSTQPVSGNISVVSGTISATQSGTWDIGNFPSTQPVSGNVSVVSGTISATQSGTWNIGNISTLPSLPTGANTIGSIKLTDGSNTPAVKAASTAPVATDPALVVTLSPNSVTVPISGNVSVTGVATDAHLTNVQSAPGTTQTTAVTIQGNTSGIAVPISGNVSVVSGTISATQSGTWNIGNISTLPSLPTGANTIGKVGIDQTTPGTTNGVVVNSSALPTGAAQESGNLALTAAALGGIADTKATNGSTSWSVIALLKWMGTSLSETLAIGAAASAFVDGSDVTQGTKTDAAYAGGASSSVIGALKGIYNALIAALPSGANIIGKVGIDQTTPGTTNGVVVNSSALPTGAAADGTDSSIATMPTGGVGIRGWLSGIYAEVAGTLTVSWTDQSVTIATVSLPSTSTSSAASSLVLKSAPGSLVTLDVAAGAVAGYIMLFDATAAPADGAVSPKWVFAMAAGGALTEDWAHPLSFATGIVAVFSSTGPFIKTESATAFIGGQVQ